MIISNFQWVGKIMEIKTRKEAKMDGDKTYFTGEACKNGHLSHRYAANGACAQCVNGGKLRLDLGESTAKKLELLNKSEIYRKELEEVARLRLEKKAAMSQMQIMKVRCFRQDRSVVLTYAYALAAMRFPTLQLEDLDPKKVPTHAEHGTAMFSFYCHDEDIENLRNYAINQFKQTCGKPNLSVFQARTAALNAELDRGKDWPLYDPR